MVVGAFYYFAFVSLLYVIVVSLLSCLFCISVLVMFAFVCLFDFRRFGVVVGRLWMCSDVFG